MYYPKARYVLLVFHNSPYDGHLKGTIIATKVLQSGYFWTSLFKDANELFKTCDRCQRIGNISMRQEIPLTNILEIELFDV